MLHYHEERAPLRRNITAEEVAAAALYLCSDAAAASPARCCTSTAGTTSWGCSRDRGDISLRCTRFSFMSSASRSSRSGRPSSSAFSPRCSWRAASCAGRGTTSAAAYDLILWVVRRRLRRRAPLSRSSPRGTQFQRDPFGLLLSGSGWVWQGGLMGGAVAVLAKARALGLPLGDVADLAGLCLAIGQAIGRVGCQLSGDGDYGIPTDLPWGMSYPNGVVPTTDRVHPTPIYESVALSADLPRAVAPARAPACAAAACLASICCAPARCASRSSSCAAIRWSRSG